MRTLLTTALVCALPFAGAIAQQVPPPKTAADLPGPPGGTLMTKAYVEAVGRMASLWGWPLVNLGNRSGAFSKFTQPVLIGGVVPANFNGICMLTDYVSPDQRGVACPNQDVVYGFGPSQLEVEPMVLQVPDSGDRFWVYPLSKFTGKMQIVDWRKSPSTPAAAGGSGETKWVQPGKFFEQLPEVMKNVPPLPGEEALYGWFKSIMDAAATDPQVAQTLK